ncbi:ABC transporter permease [Oleiharenicola lentus]|uniref:ABC transporter permease n=1 Tax=Oleiharenicola lentus TaxID=2508720 RepID=UPI003F67051D
MKTVWAKLKQLVGRRARVQRLEEEVAGHIELLVEENVRQGLDRVEARRQAHLAFGNVLATREESVDAMGWPQLESWWQDGKIAVRTLLRRPAFALSLIAILALGIGVTTAIFTLLRGVMWQSLPVPRPHELYLATELPEQATFRLSAPTVRRLENQPELSGRVAAYTSSGRLMLRRGEAPAEPMDGQFVAGGFFRALEIAPAYGRLLEPADDEIDHPRPVAVLSWHWWQQNLGGDPAVVGTELRLNGQLVTVVGIAPKTFTGISLGENIAAWLPLGMHVAMRVSPSAWIITTGETVPLADWMRSDNVACLNVLVRRPARGAVAMQGAMEAAWRPQRDSAISAFTDPQEKEQFMRRVPQLVASPQGFSSTRDGFKKTGVTLSLLVGAVVLVTLANTSTLLLLRVLARGREIGVRLALGAGRWRLARAALMEGLVLSLAGAFAGLLIGMWLTPVLADWLVPSTRNALPGVDAPMLASLTALAIFCGLALGALPAWLSAHFSPQTILRRGGVGQGTSLLAGRALIVVQLALSVLLVSVAISLALDLRQALRANLGYARESVVSTFFHLAAAGIAPEQQAATLQRLRHAAQSLPQVKAVGFASSGVLSGSRTSSGLYFRGDDARKPPGNNIQHESTDENYLSAMGIMLQRGRVFTAEDIEGKPRVALVSQKLAQQVYGETNPIGRRFGFDETPSENDWEIVGVVNDIKVNGARSEASPIIYTPLSQWRSTATCLAIRVEGDAASLREFLKKKISEAEPGLMFTRWMTIEERVQLWVRNDLAAVRLTTGFGALAILLAMVGVLGALGYLVANRSREIAVRLAIGAEPSRVWRGIVREALWLGVIGSALGLTLAILLPRVLGSWMMTGLRADVTAVIAAGLIGVLAAVVGGLLPARRAAKVDPLTLLRSE